MDCLTSWDNDIVLSTVDHGPELLSPPNDEPGWCVHDVKPVDERRSVVVWSRSLTWDDQHNIPAIGA